MPRASSTAILLVGTLTVSSRRIPTAKIDVARRVAVRLGEKVVGVAGLVGVHRAAVKRRFTARSAKGNLITVGATH